MIAFKLVAILKIFERHLLLKNNFVEGFGETWGFRIAKVVPLKSI